MEIQYGSWAAIFIEHRPSLISFAFRMTGSLADAEDLVQETFLECARVELLKIEHPKSWLMKVCSNKGIDYLKSARKRRESYIGTWLPDGLPQSLHPWPSADEGVSPEEAALLAESLTTSFLLLLEKLSPQERVIFLLSDVLGYSFSEIAKFLNKKQIPVGKRLKELENQSKKIGLDFLNLPKMLKRYWLSFFLLQRMVMRKRWLSCFRKILNYGEMEVDTSKQPDISRDHLKSSNSLQVSCYQEFLAPITIKSKSIV